MNTPYYRGITALQVFIIIISIVICGEPIEDYDLPNIDDLNNYNDYYFRPFTRYKQSKLRPDEFFQSIYNHLYQVLPNAYSKTNYEEYKYNLHNPGDKIKLTDIYKNVEDFEDLEASGDIDERYAYDPDFYESTEQIYYQSNIFREEFKYANEYLRKITKPLVFNEYINILTRIGIVKDKMVLELLPKAYENGEEFVYARSELGKLIGRNFENFLPKTKGNRNSKKLEDYYVNGNNYNTELVEVNNKDVHIKDESYGMYVLRMVNLGKVPLHPKLCNDLYGTNHDVKGLNTYGVLEPKILSDEPSSQVEENRHLN